jgi:uncharacterized protein
MTTSLSLASTPPTEAQPVDGSERLVLLDALRGFALCGVFISNVFLWFSGRMYMPRAQIEAMLTNGSLPDTVARYGVMFFVFGKFITLFSFLFGLGFAVQMGRAEQRGASILPLYARRLGVLLVIGLSHWALLWHGDILSTYALVGFGLLLFRRRADKTLLIWIAVLVLVVPTIAFILQRLPQLFGSAEVAAAAAKEAAEQTAAIKARTLEAFSGSSYVEIVKANAAFYLHEFIAPQAMFLPALFGRFLLGLMAGRRRIFHDVSQHLSLFRKVLVWGLVVGAIGGGITLVFQQLFLRKVLNPVELPWLPLLLSVMRQAGELGLAAFYLAGFTLLFQRSTWQRLLSVLAPVGRMAMTNYLSQTVLSLLIFYGLGLGLIGKLGPAASVALCLGIFTLQIGVSHLWLARFRFGPAEWLWRSLTYGKAQPMRLPPSPVAAPAAVA